MTKLQGLSGEPLETLSQVPEVVGVKPAGTQVLVERLTPQEQSGAKTIQIMENAKQDGAPQGYVLDLGPKVEGWGFEVGDRVVLTGNYTPLPEVEGKNGRDLILVEPHQVKAILVE
jgi:hypothetical protein